MEERGREMAGNYKFLREPFWKNTTHRSKFKKNTVLKNRVIITFRQKTM